MSPVVIMPGYTKRFLDGNITVESQLTKIRTSFQRISEANEVLFFWDNKRDLYCCNYIRV